ncbi:MAG TPA: cytochrome c3 family protein [Myxococcota bacterium]|nr:cytochrome c3 family protein [Myxococcota bacterium]
MRWRSSAMVLLLAPPLAWAAAPSLSGHSEQIFDRFDHEVHERALKREGLSCTACHQVGAAAPTPASPQAVDEVFLRPPEQACHYCHNPADDRRTKAPGRCETCHEQIAPPASHGAGWLELHGGQSRMGLLQCKDCHLSSECIDCHENKESISFDVHDRSWISIHGIAARADPAACSTCHLQPDCVACHADGGAL